MKEALSMGSASCAPPDDSASGARRAVDTLYAVDPAAQALGIEVLDVAPGRARLAMTVRADMLNGHGICHGGILFALADTACAYASNSHGEAMVAAGASIEFLEPARGGERLIATASETSRSGRHGIYDVVISKASGEPLAHFRGRCTRLRVPSDTRKP
jgi:acyl-CoA thioesterase